MSRRGAGSYSALEPSPSGGARSSCSSMALECHDAAVKRGNAPAVSGACDTSRSRGRIPGTPGEVAPRPEDTKLPIV